MQSETNVCIVLTGSVMMVFCSESEKESGSYPYLCPTSEKRPARVELAGASIVVLLMLLEVELISRTMMTTELDEDSRYSEAEKEDVGAAVEAVVVVVLSVHVRE